MVKLSLKDVVKKQNSFMLNIDDLEINKGDFFGLIGASGCGKTTLLKIIAGLLTVDKGNIYIEDNDVTNIPAEKRNIGMVFQQPLLFPHMTVEQNISFGLKMQKVNKKERIKQVENVLHNVGLEGFQNRYPSELSGGQQQRVALARAIVCKPEILLMDEPFSALDPKLREEMRELISKIHKQYSMTIIFVTHDKEEAFILFNNMALIKDGQILQIGSPKHIYQNPSHTYTAEFLGAKNIFYGKVYNDIFVADNLKFKLANSRYHGRYGNIILRPECFEISRIKEDEIKSNSNVFLGIVKQYSYRQGFLFIKVDVNSKLIEVTQKVKSDIDFEIGEKVILEYDIDKISLIMEE